MNQFIACFDLDDTLYPERHFQLSGFNEVAHYVARMTGLGAEEIFKELVRFSRSNPGNVFDKLLEGRPWQISVRDLVQTYRNHQPRIELWNGMRSLLQHLEQHGGLLALITDGPMEQQSHKIDALGLGKMFGRVEINDGTAGRPVKPNTASFQRIQAGQSVPAFYVADNAAKDFLGAKMLGWSTFQLVMPGQVHGDKAAIAGGEPEVVCRGLANLWAELDNWISKKSFGQV